jgi:hypothetical protein
LTSVSEPSSAATPHLADVSGNTSPARSGPRCHCGTPITYTPGKVPRVYCSDRCRKAAKRAIAKSLTASGGNPGQLGKETTEFPTPLRPAETSSGAKRDAASRTVAAKARKSRRYAGRRTLWQISSDRTCRGCGRTVMDPDSGVILARTAEGNAVVLGLLKCGKLWLCPVCSATIRHGRPQEITRAVVAWIAMGGTAHLVTFTARHAATDKLATLMDAIQGTRKDEAKGIKRQPGAYQRLITGGTWAGRPERGLDGIRDRVGYIGMIRATEITVGQINGWHPHIHAIVFLGGELAGTRADKRITGVFSPSASAVSEFEGHFRSVWTSHLAKLDPEFKPSDRHGVDFKRLETVQDAQDLGQYIAKIQDGDKAVSPANELARGDLKSGRNGNMAPFQLLGRLGDLMGGVPDDEADGHGDQQWCHAKWAEYETATKGRRAIEWTRYLRPLLGIEGGDTAEDDMDVLAGMEGLSEYREGVRVDTGAWHKVTHRALDLATTEAAEDGRWEDVTGLVTAAGARSGAVRHLSPGEIEEAWEATLATLAARREAAAARRRIEQTGSDPHA